MDTRLVSVVVPVYNTSRFLKETVLSVLNQTYQELELVLVNDCSTDHSLEIANSFAAEDSRVRVISLEKNGGVANARNIGIKAAKGTYIALLDSDDYWEPDKIEKQIALMAEKSADIGYCSFDLVDEQDQPVGSPFLVPPETDYDEMLTRCVFNCCTSVFRADLLKAHPFRLDQYHEDYVLWMELMSLPIRAVGVGKILAHNRQVGHSRSHNKIHAARERWRIYRGTFGFGILRTAALFIQYGIKGVKKYYM